MEILFIITKVENANVFYALQKSILLTAAEPNEKPYATYKEAEDKIPSLGEGLFQIQKIFGNQ